MRKFYISFLAILLLFSLSCSEELNVFESGEKKEKLMWDTTYTVSVKVPRNSVCWITTETENIGYFSGAVISDNKTTHIGKGEFITTLDYLNFDLILNKDFSLNTPEISQVSIDIDCNNGEFVFKKTYDINK